MTTTAAPTGRAFYDRQLEFLTSKDVEGLIANQYAPDAELISFDFVVKGADALVEHFRGYLEQLGGLEVVSTDQFRATDDTIFFEATVKTGAYGVVRVYDAWTLDSDGRILKHFTGRFS